MKIFEAVMECQGNEEIETQREYVTSQADTLQSVVDYFTRECAGSGRKLKSVSEDITIARHIVPGDD